MNSTLDDLAALENLANRWLRISERRFVAEAQLRVTDEESPLHPERQDEYDRLDIKLIRLESRLVGLATRCGAVAPRHVRIGDLIIAVALDAGIPDRESRIAVIDLRSPAPLTQSNAPARRS
jgi:hypothetical protein